MTLVLMGALSIAGCKPMDTKSAESEYGIQSKISELSKEHPFPISSYILYRIQPEDTLGTILQGICEKEFNKNPDIILQKMVLENNLSDSNTIFSGNILRIPTSCLLFENNQP